MEWCLNVTNWLTIELPDFVNSELIVFIKNSVSFNKHNKFKPSKSKSLHGFCLVYFSYLSIVLIQCLYSLLIAPKHKKFIPS